MLYVLQAGALIPCDTANEGDVVAVVSKRVMQEEAIHETFLDHIVKTALLNDTIRFESHDKLDVLCVMLHQQTMQHHVHIFLQQEGLWFVCEHDVIIDEMMQRISQQTLHELNFGRILYVFFDEILDHETLCLDRLEDDITYLEDAVISNKANEALIKEIITLRKRLLKTQRDYDQMQDVLEHIDANVNHLFDHATLRYFEIMNGKLNRLTGRVATLQAYVTEIREAYQAEVDINLNVTMKFFTVITTIFMPLTLLVGWYGMNLKMPEYEEPFAYPILIVCSSLIIIVSTIYFKKHKWF